MSIRDEVHKMLDDAIAKLKEAAASSDRFDRLDSFLATVHMVIDEIELHEAASASPAPSATAGPLLPPVSA